jgi:hypothetical protein
MAAAFTDNIKAFEELVQYGAAIPQLQNGSWTVAPVKRSIVTELRRSMSLSKKERNGWHG